MNFESVAGLYRQSNFLQSKNVDISIDLQEVGQVDSAGIALLLAWSEQASNHNQSIEWLNMPEQMERLVRINRLEGLFFKGA